jgi:hypothetical protein
MSSTAATTIAFLCGDDMNPESIRKRPGFASARFTGIGSVAASDIPGFPTDQDRVWGLVLEGVEPGDGPVVEIRRRDGGVVRGEIRTGETAWRDLDRLVSEARYWELPGQYLQSLKQS